MGQAMIDFIEETGDTPAVVPACPFLEGRPVIRQLRRDA
jgi:hypothetical protein